MHQTCTGNQQNQALWVHPSVVARLFVFFLFFGACQCLVLSSKPEGSKFAFGLGFRALKCLKQRYLQCLIFSEPSSVKKCLNFRALVFCGVLLSKIKCPYGPAMKQFLFDLSLSHPRVFLGFRWSFPRRDAQNARKVHDKGREEAGSLGPR